MTPYGLFWGPTLLGYQLDEHAVDVFNGGGIPRRSPSWPQVVSAVLRILDYPEEHLSEMDGLWIVTMTIQTSFS